MNVSKNPDGIPVPKRTLSRRAALVLAPFALLFAHGFVPWLLSLIGHRYGWVSGHPSGWNLFGLVPVAGGVAVLAWQMVYGWSQAARVPDQINLDWSPKLLLTGGPYAFSRHPMYIGELTLWLGWAGLFGSLPVLIGLLALCFLVRVLAPKEEKSLEAIFGAEYQDYKSRVPQWIGFRKR